MACHDPSPSIKFVGFVYIDRAHPGQVVCALLRLARVDVKVAIFTDEVIEMGLMLDGVYQVDEPAPDSVDDGRYRRQSANIRNWINAKDPIRYHLFVAWNCPWAHRTLLTRALLGLKEHITISVALPRRTDQGWVFDKDGDYSDPLLGVRALHEVYAKQHPAYTGRITMPVLWDKKTEQIISNESADIVRMLGQIFDPDQRLCHPSDLDQIDHWNGEIYPKLNNGVYRSGFARTQAAYDEAVVEVFDMLDKIEAQLAQTPALCGTHLTEADIRLFPTLARFDVAYHYAFKCNLRKISDYPNLWDYARAFYALPGIAETVKFDIYKSGYFSPSELRNPSGIVPIGPILDWSEPATRTLSLR